MSCGYTVRINLPSHVLDDKWEGISTIGPVLVNEAVPAGALTRVTMELALDGVTFTLDTEGTPDAPITIDNATTWEASIPEVQDFLPTAGDWIWNMQFYESPDTSPLTFYKGVLRVTDL
jgi:hypothetical protein